MWDEVAVFCSVHFEKLFFSIITMVIGVAVLWDVHDKNYPPGPMGIPFLGYLPFLHVKAPHLVLAELAQQYGRIYSVNLGSMYTVVISDIKMLRDVFALDSYSGRPKLYLQNTVMTEGKGLSGAEGQGWKDHRRFVGNIFKDWAQTKGSTGQSILETKIQKSAQDFVTELRNTAGQSFEANELVRHHVGNTLTDLILGTKFEKEDKSWKYLQLVLQERFRALNLTNFVNFVPWLRRFGQNATVLSVLKEGKVRTDRVFRDVLDKQQRDASKTVPAKNEPVQSVLDAYLFELSNKGSGKETRNFNNDQVQHVLSDLVSAGWDTTMTSLNWLYLYMALYPQIQERVVQEIDGVVGKNKEVTLKHFEQLSYTRAVVLEIWRHRVILPLGVPHRTLERTKIGEFWIPKGSMILANLWAIHHDPRLWKNPADFIPDRHLNDDGSLCLNENILPFQTGQRSCTGEDLGRQIVQLFFANTLSQFRINSAKGCKFNEEELSDCGYTLAPRPFQLKVELRK